MSRWVPFPIGEWSHADILELDIGEQLPSWVSRTDAVHFGDRIVQDLSLKFSWCYRYYLVQGNHVIVKQRLERVDVLKDKEKP